MKAISISLNLELRPTTNDRLPLRNPRPRHDRLAATYSMVHVMLDINDYEKEIEIFNRPDNQKTLSEICAEALKPENQQIIPVRNYSELKRLAKESHGGVIRSHGWDEMIEDSHLLRGDKEFMKACTPETILKLIEENFEMNSAAMTYIEEMQLAQHQNELLLEGMTRIMQATKFGDPAFAIATEIVGELSAEIKVKGACHE